MPTRHAELKQQIDQADDRPVGAAKIAELENLVGSADTEGFADLSIEARVALISSYHTDNQAMRIFAPFAWCLAQWDAAPETVSRSNAEMLRWHYKWAVSLLEQFPDVSLDQTYAALDDMESRYRRGGHSLHAVHSRRHQIARHVGDWTTAEREFPLWMSAPRDENSDCRGCDPEFQLIWKVLQGDDAGALELAGPVVQGHRGCVEQPHSILAECLLPLVRQGELTDAARAHQMSYRHYKTDRGALTPIALHLDFLARTGNEERGLELLRRHISWLDQPQGGTPPTPAAAMRFTSSSALLLRRLLEMGHGDEPILRRVGEAHAAITPTVAELCEDFSARALRIAAAFDARNSTSTQGDAIRARLTAEPLVSALPLG